MDLSDANLNGAPEAGPPEPPPAASPGEPEAPVAGPDWCAVYTKSRHEKAVDSALKRLGLESYLPIRQEVRRWKDRRKLVDFPLFPGYVFARCGREERARAFAVRGLVRFVGGEGGIAPVPESEIEAIRETLRRHVPFDPFPELQPGQSVEMIAGPMRGIRGTLIKRGRKYRLVLAVRTLGRGIAVEVDSCDARPA